MLKLAKSAGNEVSNHNDTKWRSSVPPSTYVPRMAAFIKWPSHTKHVSTCRVLVMAPKSFKLDLYSCKQLLKDSFFTLIWFCCVLCFWLFSWKYLQSIAIMSYIASGGSQMPSFSPVFSKFSRGGMPLDPPSIASQSRRSHSCHWPSNCIGRYWQTLVDIFKTYLPIGRLFSFSKCNPAFVKIYI